MPIGLPSISVEPEVSTICINASHLAKSERNWFPLPLPSCAPGTSPATSINVIGTNLVKPTHEPELGEQILPFLSSLISMSIFPSFSFFILN